MDMIPNDNQTQWDVREKMVATCNTRVRPANGFFSENSIGTQSRQFCEIFHNHIVITAK